jgi:hypothetical protein
MIDPNSPRAAASRRNGARSKGPKTPEGKARSSMNALKHGLTALRWMVLYDEDMDDFDALIEVWAARFEPAEPCEALLVRRLAEADWRLRRASRIEFEMFDSYQYQDDDGHNPLALALIRDGHGANAFGNLLRYRGGAEREFHRLYKMLSEAKARREAEEGAKRTEAAAGHAPVTPPEPCAAMGFDLSPPTCPAPPPVEACAGGFRASVAAAVAEALATQRARAVPAGVVGPVCETTPSAAVTAGIEGAAGLLRRPPPATLASPR